MTRTAFGLDRLYQRGARTAPTIRALVDVPPVLDHDAIEAHLTSVLPADRTCFAGITPVPRPAGVALAHDEFASVLRDAIAVAGPATVALSGGLDSAVVLALAREVHPSVSALVLDPQLPGYSERDAALATARALGCPVEVVPVTADDLLAALPAAIATFETPLYNLHPLSKWLLARAARDRGITTLLSGDGADQVFTRDTSNDYLPLVGAAFDAHDVTLSSPFLAPRTIAHLLALPPDRDKRALRDVAASLGVPAPLVHEPKVSRLAPPLLLDTVVPRSMLEALAARLDRPLPVLADDRLQVRWSTLALLVEAFGGAAR
jgi:asparagine synthetase B (glutamine-hydrolysing)